MSDTVDNTLRFQAMTCGVDRDTDAVTVGFEMDRRPGHDSRGLLVSRATPEHDKGDGVYVEFGEPQQHCMYGGIERARSTPGHFRIRFTEAGAEQMAGLRAIEVDYDEGAEVVPELLNALDYIFEGFGGYSTDTEPDASPNGGPAAPPGNSGVSEGPPSVS
jgi:hypothetical protein